MSDFLTFRACIRYEDGDTRIWETVHVNRRYFQCLSEGERAMASTEPWSDWSREVHPDDVEALRTAITGQPPQDPVSIKTRTEMLREAFSTTPDQTKP